MRSNVFALLILGAFASGYSTVASAERPDTRGPKPRPVDPPSAAAVEASIGRGVAYLIDSQNENGSWGSATRTKGLNIYAPIPGAHHGFRAAVTSLALMALVEVGDADDEKTKQAINKGEAFLLAQLPRVRRATPDAIYNVWAHAYSIQALIRLHSRHDNDANIAREIRRQIREQIALLERYESVDGGWGYYDFRLGTKKPASSSTSFTNAACLVALYEAEQFGIKPPQKLIRRALAATMRQRKNDGTFVYGEYLKMQPVRDINRPGGSLGRSQACNIALYLWDEEKITQEVMITWLDRLFARNGWLDIGRKRPRPHEAWFAVAGYFYYFGHYYGALCIDQLDDQDEALRLAGHMNRLMLSKQEKDGSWWDFPFYDYHQPYGTAFALLSLRVPVELTQPDRVAMTQRRQRQVSATGLAGTGLTGSGLTGTGPDLHD